MIIERELKKKLHSFRDSSPVVTITGPRQSGKTTLARETFPNYTYINLEKPNMREVALSDPVRLLDSFTEGGMIIDEAQYAPELFSYIQAIVDEHEEARFILTGSQNFLLSAKISQSLAGRVRILDLLPLSIKELKKSLHAFSVIESYIFRGGYPAIYNPTTDIESWFLGYIQTYLERDVRQLSNIHSLSQFQTFVKLCASRIGQVLNYTSLANDVGVKDTTIRQWVGVLEASYIMYTLKPYYKNFGKRLIKSPKVYFYDTGLACALLDINNEHQLGSHYLKGGLFENAIINEIRKAYTNQGKRGHLYYWRESNGIEIDLLIEQKDMLIPIEIKSSKTMKLDFASAIKTFRKASRDNVHTGYVIYGGEESFKEFISWRKAHIILSTSPS